MPLIPAKPGSASFGRNIAEMERSGHPLKQSLAATYAEAKRTHDAPRAAAVRVIGGDDPGEQGLTAVPRRPYAQAAGQPWSVPPNPTSQPVPEPMVSKTPHEAPSVTPAPTIPSEPLLRVANASGTDARGVPVLGRDTAGEREGDGGDPEEGRGEGNLGDPRIARTPAPPAVREETSMPALGDEHIGFKAVEEKAAKEYGSKEAGERVAAVVGREKYGANGMAKKAAGRDEDLPDPVEEANRVNRSPPVY